MSISFRILWLVTWPFFNLFFPRKTYGKENRPGEGAYLICANHPSSFDPFMLTYSVGLKHHIHFMGKIEIFNVPLVGTVLRGIGMIPVDRTSGGAMAMKQAMKLLKSGKKVGMFPEGTRVKAEEGAAAKAGTVRMAARMNVPILPVYIENNKKLFRRNKIVIGQAYSLLLDKTASAEEFDEAASALMKKIQQLGETVG